ncbi:MAG: IPTL-CTERM sorting domain-containing protein [Comamonas sp.]
MTTLIRRRAHCVLLAAAGVLASHAVLASGISIPQGASINSGAGTVVGMGCGDLTVEGSYTQLGNAGLGNMSQLALVNGGRFTAGTGTVALSGLLDVSNGTFSAGSSTVAMVPVATGCAGGGQGQIKGGPHFYNWHVSGTAVSLPVAQQVIVTHGLDLKNAQLRGTAAVVTSTLASKAGTLEPIKPPDNTQAWLAYTGTATPAISSVGVDGVQSIGAWLAADQTNQISGGTAINWFARATLPDPGPVDPVDPGGDGGSGNGGGTASAHPVPTLGAGGLLALSAALGGLAALRRRHTGR